ncbi:MAG: sulfotransferase family protein [Nocardioides sp.]
MSAGARRLVLVLGPGRSGTSTMAGALAYSGYRVPQAIRGNETNPAGFFEPRWVVNFHRKLLTRADVRTLDTDPAAFERMAKLTGDPAVRDELAAWLAGHLESKDRLVIKDPRLVWFRDLWVDVARAAGVEPGFVMMLRHPSEVSSSRSEYYNAGEVTGVAGWVNVALMTERLTSGSPRALVLYPELTADWRAQLTRVRDQLGIELEPDPSVTPHPVDDFIDPQLRRMRAGWADSHVPGFLRDLGDRTFDALASLAGEDPATGTTPALTELAQEYTHLHADCLAVVKPHTTRARTQAARRAARRARTQERERASESGDHPAAADLVGRVRARLARTVRR